MIINILTLFPEMFVGPFAESIVKRAQEKGLVEIKIHNLRDWADDKYKTVDDRPYGGGAGMILKIDVIERAIFNIKSQITNPNFQVNSNLRNPNSKTKSVVILLDAGGKQFSQKKAQELAKIDSLILICGHYEGVDHRVHEHLVDEIISVGPYVLSGGEIPAMTITDAITRLLPGSLGNPESLKEESHNTDGVEYPQYTRPDEYKGWAVPEVLLGGNHKEIKKWRDENGQVSCSEPLSEKE